MTGGSQEAPRPINENIHRASSRPTIPRDNTRQVSGRFDGGFIISEEAAADVAKGKGTKDDKGKVKIALLDPYFIEELARHMEKGMIKYKRGNWQLDLEPERILNACIRHALAIIKGELTDPENGSNHSIAIAANAMMLYFAERHGNVVKTEHDKK